MQSYLTIIITTPPMLRLMLFNILFFALSLASTLADDHHRQPPAPLSRALVELVEE